MSLRQQLSDIDSGFAKLVTVWLSGVLAGELLVVVTLGTIREFRSVTTSTDWAVAIGLALLSIAILVIAIRDELSAD